MKLILKSEGRIGIYKITPEQATVLNDNTDKEAELNGCKLFKEITGRDINDFVVCERGKWEVR